MFEGFEGFEEFKSLKSLVFEEFDVSNRLQN
jgi:hypothetical protein